MRPSVVVSIFGTNSVFPEVDEITNVKTGLVK